MPDMQKLQTGLRMIQVCTLRLNYRFIRTIQRALSSIDSKSSTAERRLKASISLWKNWTVLMIHSWTKTSKNFPINEVIRTLTFTKTLLAISKAEES